MLEGMNFGIGFLGGIKSVSWKCALGDKSIYDKNMCKKTKEISSNPIKKKGKGGAKHV